MKNYKTQITKTFIALLAISFSFVACEDDDEIETRIVDRIVTKTDTVKVTDTLVPQKYAVQINFKNMVNGNALQMNTSNKPYTNEQGQNFNVTKLRYMISDVAFHKADGSCFTIDEYHLVDASDANTLVWDPMTRVPEGDYSSISFTFGFDKEDNVSNQYPDLNTAIWNWPAMLGGGYHFMQLEGKFDTSGVEGGFATHMGMARNNTVSPTTFEQNYFESKPMNSAITIPDSSSFDIIMHIEEWYKNPYTWDFKVYNQPIMPIYDAQRKLNLNGPSVFTIEI